MKTKNYLAIVCLLVSVLKLIGQTQVLFEQKEVLNIEIKSNMNVLLKDRGDNRIYHKGVLLYNDTAGNQRQIDIKLKTRGRFRLDPINCSFPPLMLDFSQKKTKNTLFENQNKLKLVTVCKSADYVIREYLVYQIYNLITDLSFKTRMVNVQYTDSLQKRKTEVAYGFFIENENQLALRIGGKSVERKNISMVILDSMDMATFAIFQYMIGNNDWTLTGLHNMKLLGKKGKMLIPIAYDFDYAGIMETPYAVPPLELEIRSVRERLYRGLNYTPSVFESVFEKFRQEKQQIYALYEDNPLLDKGYIKRTIKYLDEFYDSINDPKAIKKYFVAGKTKNR
jgi:hypothetical protein